MEVVKMLVVDDEPYLLRSLTFILSKEGYQITMASNGDEALQKLAEDIPQLVFLDVMMPQKNGYEVLEAIRSNPLFKNIYVIILSAKGSDLDRARALSSGANEYITKPFSPVEVVKRVKDIVQLLNSAEKQKAVVT